MAETVEKVLIPDIGGAENVDVIEVMVSAGDTISQEDPLITLEGDKATMEIPAPIAGVVESISVKVGDKVSEGDLILTVKVSEQKASAEKSESKKVASKKTDAQKSSSEKSDTKKAEPEKAETKLAKSEVRIPDIGDAKDVDVIEIAVKVGDEVNAEDTLITLEGDKATMDIPAPFAGKITDIKLKLGDKVSQDDLILIMETAGEQAVAEKKAKPPEKVESQKEAQKISAESAAPEVLGEIHAGPAVRRLAHEIGLDLAKIKGTGEKGRILKEDVRNYVAPRLQGQPSSGMAFNFLPAPKVDFAKFGEVELKPLSKIKKISGMNLARNWVSIPHVTQFDEADITEMEAFRQAQKAAGYKLTPLVFIMKAVIAALREFPIFNASLDESGENIVIKKYFHIGVAVDTPNGLMVPVIRDADKKGLFDLAKELGDVSSRVREKGLGLADMQGGCFTISSLGGIGGTAFTPIINAPEVAILGVSKSFYKPIYQSNATFEPRLMLPLSLSYDHRVIDGADGARFITHLSKCLADIRALLL